MLRGRWEIFSRVNSARARIVVVDHFEGGETVVADRTRLITPGLAAFPTSQFVSEPSVATRNLASS